MTPSSYNEIKEQILDEWAYFESDEDRAISETADSFVPIYNSDIIREWSGLSSDDSDRWHEYGYATNELVSITDLMRIDLAIYYDELTRSIVDEIKEEKEEAN